MFSGWSAAQKKTHAAAEQDHLDVAIARDVWRAAQLCFDASRLVFIDETGITTSMTRLRVWGIKGQAVFGQGTAWPLKDIYPRIGGGRVFVASLAQNGILAPILINTPPQQA